MDFTLKQLLTTAVGAVAALVLIILQSFHVGITDPLQLAKILLFKEGKSKEYVVNKLTMKGLDYRHAESIVKELLLKGDKNIGRVESNDMVDEPWKNDVKGLYRVLHIWKNMAGFFN